MYGYNHVTTNMVENLISNFLKQWLLFLPLTWTFNTSTLPIACIYGFCLVLTIKIQNIRLSFVMKNTCFLWDITLHLNTNINRCSKLILKWIFKKQAGVTSNGLIWLRIGTSCGLLWTRRNVDWIDLAEGRNNWRTLLNTVMNLWFPYDAESFLTSWETSSFSRRTLFHGV